jgi:hypothetical protein
MRFDWQGFCEKYSITYTDRGANTAKGNIYVDCPFCSENDHGPRMGLSEDNSKGWGCWRESSHRGRAPQRLIAALLRCGFAEADRIAGAQNRSPSGASATLASIRAALSKPVEVERRTLEMPKEFKPLTPNSLHWKYLREERGFSQNDCYSLADIFDLKQTTAAGDWSWRIIVPVYNEASELVTWQGRAIGEAKLRYKSLSDKEETKGPRAIGPISDYLFDMAEVELGSDFLVITEGWYDFAKLWVVASASKVNGAAVTCLFGKVISPEQLDFLASIRSSYKRVFILLDPDAKMSALKMGSQLTALDVTPAK